MTRETVSVVIPAYNAARFLAEAIESVLAQTVAPAEVIVVDDGSTDQTGRIAMGFSEVRLISLAHSGVSVARNHGVGAATGSFIAFLDADDTWRPDKLDRQLSLARSSPEVGVVMARQAYRFEGLVPAWFRGPTDGSSEPGYMPSNWLVRRRSWEVVGGFDERMSHSEDTDWLARAVDLGVAVAMVDEPLVTHRIHDSNASGLPREVRQGVLRALRDSVHRKQGAP
ncbi:MAG: glycosyltransferase family 2 protein [Dehalococcoidia bacterium]|nr:glycosyltransferase family 2 protein [Dehalococcoidia bacterium]